MLGVDSPVVLGLLLIGVSEDTWPDIDVSMLVDVSEDAWPDVDVPALEGSPDAGGIDID